VADFEEVEIMQNLMDNMVREKRQVEKGRKNRGSSSKESVGSFELISEHSHASTNRKNKTPMKMETGSSSQPSSRINEDKMCFCGLTPMLYTCRKEGRNFMRQFLRCPKQPDSGKQCEFFQWLEDTKAQQYEKMYDLRASMETSPKPKSIRTPSGSPFGSGSNSSDTEDPLMAQSPANSTQRGARQPARCPNEWSRRGTNAHVKVKTCKLCGFQERTRYKDLVTTQCWVDVKARSNNTKKSKNDKKAPLRSVSP
jgi:hypothetical protein